MQTITAMFDSRPDAEAARHNLAAAGIAIDDVTIHDQASVGENTDGRKTMPVSTGNGSAAPVSDGHDGTHRNAIGDYIDNNTGKRLMEDAGSERNALGDYIDSDHKDKPASHNDNGADHHDAGAGVWSQLKSFFTADHDVYAEGMRRGGFLLVARVGKDDADRAAAILDVEGTVDLGARETEWRSQGWMGGPSTMGGTTPPRSRVSRHDTDIFGR